MEIFPPRNLPQAAADWGRAVESEIVSSEGQIVQASQTINNGLRGLSGQFATSSNRITELFKRSIEIVSVPGLSVPPSGSTTSVAFPGLDEQVSSFISLDFTASSSGSSGGVFEVAVSLQGGLVFTGAVEVNANNARQPSFFRNLGVFSRSGRALTPNGSIPVFDIEFFGRPSVTFSVSNITASLTRSGTV